MIGRLCLALALVAATSLPTAAYLLIGHTVGSSGVCTSIVSSPAPPVVISQLPPVTVC